MWGDLLAKGLSAASVPQAHRVLSRALKGAMQHDKVARNVCTLVDAAIVEREEIRPSSAQDARRVLEAERGRRNEADGRWRWPWGSVRVRRSG